jgi:hypothetical protein
LPRFPQELLDAPSARRARPHLELVAEVSASSIPAAAPAPTDDAAVTHIFVPVTCDAPRDPESQRRFEDFWVAKPAPLLDQATVFLPVFPRVPLLQRAIVLPALLSVAVIAAVAVWIAIFVLLSSSMSGAETSDLGAVESNTAAR